MSRHTDTIAALATPVGTAAIAVVRASGPDTRRLVSEIFGFTPTSRVAHHADYRVLAGTLVDDVLFIFFEGPRSYTGEDSLEVSCHGNPFIAQMILEDFLARGCRSAEPGEFTQRAFLSGRMDLSQAEAVMDLIHARSERALVAANHQLRGALGRRLTALTDRLLGVLAHVEAYIDFPDEDLPPADRQLAITELDEITQETSRLLATNHYGDILRDGIKTVILGAPNAGKSSLLNLMVGNNRALVSPEPGTTRDFIEERMLVGPHGLRLIDTAGLNPSPAPLEKLGIAKTMERAAEADLILLVFDATLPAPALPAEVEMLIGAKPTIWVINKSDLLRERTAAVVPPIGARLVLTSALNGDGLEALSQAITEVADGYQQDFGDEVVSINARHATALARASLCLKEAKEKLRGSAPVELLASDLRDGLDAFGEIGGKIDNERMLDQLFAAFCIGK